MYENIHKIHATQWEMEKCRKFFTQFDICLMLGSFFCSFPFLVHCVIVSPLPQSEPLRNIVEDSFSSLFKTVLVREFTFK